MRPTDIAMNAIEPHPGDALLIIDVQNDFLPGGCLAVPAATTRSRLEPLHRGLQDRDLPIIATRDWHPANHCSFEMRGGVWPPHCIAGTQGAAFPSTLRIPCDTVIVSKATTSEHEAHSAFEGTDLCAHLRDLGTRRIFVGGLATEYCVLSTVRDAMRLGSGSSSSKTPSARSISTPATARVRSNRCAGSARSRCVWKPSRPDLPRRRPPHRPVPAHHAPGLLQRRRGGDGSVRVLRAKAAAQSQLLDERRIGIGRSDHLEALHFTPGRPRLACLDPTASSPRFLRVASGMLRFPGAMFTPCRKARSSSRTNRSFV